MIKRETRILGIDDGYFKRNKDNETLLVGVVTRGYLRIDGVLSEYISVDGSDATEKMIDMITKSGHYNQIRIIITNGITFAGFNMFDPEALYSSVEIPIIIVVRKKPNIDKFLNTISKIYGKNDWRIKILEKLELPKPVKTKYGIVYYQKWGISDEKATNIIRFLAKYSRIPEPVRIAHLIAMGVTLGYSKGKP